MARLDKTVFVCMDCETTGLDTHQDRIIELAIQVFTFDRVIDTFETLIDPEQPIPLASQAIHHISDEMVVGCPKIEEILDHIVQMIPTHSPIVGHGIQFDIDILAEACRRHNRSASFIHNTKIDTVRLARIYGESETNSLKSLREHFHLEELEAHRAMNDVTINIEVFKFLSKNYRSLEEVVQKLDQPILMKTIPLGKYKGRLFSELPLDYLRWAAHQKFDKDLIFSLRSELKKRKNTNSYGMASNPFQNL